MPGELQGVPGALPGRECLWTLAVGYFFTLCLSILQGNFTVTSNFLLSSSSFGSLHQSFVELTVFYSKSLKFSKFGAFLK